MKKIESLFGFEEKAYDTGLTCYAYFWSSLVREKQDLLNGIYWTLGFPYFGFNWDALNDCLGNLDWIEKEKVVLVHEELPRLPDNDLRTYLEILESAIEAWRIDEPHVTAKHELEVVFLGEGAKEKIVSLLKGYEL